MVAPAAKPQIRIGTKLGRWASGAGEPDSVTPKKSSTISPEASIWVLLQLDTAVNRMPELGERRGMRRGARLPKSRSERYQDDHERGTQQGGEERRADRGPQDQERDDGDARGRDALASV